MSQFFISHRGNLTGPDPSRENSPVYIQEALDAGFDVEVDVWYVNYKWYLGHDNPQYETTLNFLSNRRLWCHAKHLSALTQLIRMDGYIWHSFWHENDRYTMTSCNHIWTFPRVLEIGPKCIIVYPELYPDGFDFSIAAGICSNHIQSYKP